MLGGAEKDRFLSQVKDGAYRIARRAPIKTTIAPVRGSIAEYMARYAGKPQEKDARAVLLNKVKVCPTCGKPNGFTMATCNKCQHDLSPVVVSFTNNLFSSFVLGIEREPRFPLTLSMRLETDRLMVFDDPLALSPLHFCAIPTTSFIPDWRYLTLRPREGLALSQELVAACHRAAEEQFLSDAEWCRSLIATGGMSAADMAMGYNCPPSQNQLHVQYMMPLLIPHQYMMFLRGVHYTPKRFFPVAYVEKTLQRLAEADTKLDLAHMDLPIEDLLDVLREKCGVDYDGEHSAFMEKMDRQQKVLANWKREHFGGISRIEEKARAGELVFESFSAPGLREAVPEHTVYEREKSVLQSYGRAAGEGAPSMGYYSHPKTLEGLDMSYVRSSPRQMRQIIDLTQTLRDGMDVYEGDPPVHITTVRTRAADGWELRALSMGSHTGTHCDAPCHMHEGGATLDEIPLTRFCGPALAVARQAEGYPSGTGLLFVEPITEADVAQLLAARPPFVGGDMDEATERALLGSGIVTYTDLENLDLLPRGRVFQFYGLPLKIEAGDGSPVRAVAIID